MDDMQKTSEVSSVMDSPMVTSNIENSSSSELTSPANTSTGIKKKMDETLANRRLSSRVKAKPAYFDASPIVSISQSSNSPNLTSPPLDDVIADKENVSEEEMEETVVEEIEEDNEIVFKKPASKRKSKGTLDVTVKKGKMSAKKKTTKTPEDDEENSSLFEIVKLGKSALVSVINDWIETYNDDKSQAMVELIQFFVNSSGCNAKVAKTMIEEEDTVRAIRHLTENFGEQAEEYPLIISRPEFKKFKANFVSFILQLINQCQHTVIYDDEMMDILICWIIGLSDSQVRAFRHTSTLAGMKIVTGLIDVALKAGIELDNTQKQLDSENQKTASKKSKEKLNKLQKRREELRQNKTELEYMMNRIFSGIFVHRYRDIRSEIRSICIAEIGTWMDKYSTLFLNQNYLKYVGWLLYDKVGDVRLQVLKVLEKLYENEDYIENLELFTGRFKNRLIHMTLDVDNDVAVQAIKIASILYRYDVLDEDDCSQVEQLVYCDQRRMAHAAGEFLASRIIRLSIEASPKKLRKGHKESYLRQMNVKAILDFFIKTEIHQTCAYIVDSLWEHTDLLKDWKTMTNLLLDTNSHIDLEDEEETALIDLMCSACEQAANGTGPPGRVVNKKLSQKDKKTHQEDRYSISTHFMENLPLLLEKYKADVQKTEQLLTIPQYFDLEVYAEKRLTKHLESTLKHMEDIVMKHADTELLNTCSETYHYLIDNELVIQQTAEVSRNGLLDKIVEKFRKSIAHGIPTEDDDKDSQAYYNTVTSLKRINAFNINHDLSDWDLYQDINAIIDQGVNGSVAEEVLILAVNIMCMNHFLMLEFESPSKTELKAMRKRQKLYVKQLDELLQFSELPVKTEIFKILCDYFIMFSKQLLNKAPGLAQIVYTADPSLQVRMRDFIITNVFNTVTDEDIQDEEEDDAKVQELKNKRVLLAGLCKLIAYDMFDIKLAAPIFVQFLRAYAEYSDIIKQLMQKAKESNLIVFSKVLLFALQQAFESLRDDSEGVIDTRCDEFGAIKDLARRFALTLGVNINLDNTRKSTITIHREGITYAFSYPIDPSLSPSKQNLPDTPPNLLFLEILHEFTYRVTKIDRKVILKHLENTAGDMLSKKGGVWSPVRTYKNGLDSGVNETKISDEAERELEEELAMEKKSKKKKTSFANETNQLPAGSKRKAKKKLSLSKVGGNDQWLSKQSIENESQESAPKVARAIPRVRKSNEGDAKKSSSDESSDEDETLADVSSRISPKKQLASKGGSMASKDTPIGSTKKKTPARKGAVATVPIRLTSGVESSSTDSPIKEVEDSSQPEESDSDVSSVVEGEDESIAGASQKSWLASQQRPSAKKPKKNYSAKSISPLKRNRSRIDESSQDSGSDISSPSAREMRASKRQKREIPSALLQDSQISDASQETEVSQDLPAVF